MVDLTTPLPGGRYRITRAENERLCAAVGATADRLFAHPVFHYVATQVGMGLSVAELCTRCDFDVADGPMLTQSKANFTRRLRIEQDYKVTGQILSLIRRPSRSFGAVDMLRYQLDLLEGDVVAVTIINEWLLPRRGAQA